MEYKDERKRLTSCKKTQTFYQKFFPLFWPSNLWPPSSWNLNPLDYAIWDVLENKTNATSHPNIGLLKTATEDQMSEEFILKVCKLFQRCVDTIKKKMVAILSKFTVLCLSSYFAYFFKLKLILFLKESFIIILEYSEFCFHTLNTASEKKIIYF